MKVLKVLGIILGIILIAGAVMMIALPGEVHVERDIVITAEPEMVYSTLVDMEEFNTWSPWFEKDPNTSYEYEGPKKGIGAKLIWTSDHPDVGDGSMWIEDTTPNEMIKNGMSFGDYPGVPSAYFYLEPVEEGTKVTWTYDEEVSGIGKIFVYFMDMDAMLGPDYEKGLWNLKIQIEAEAEEQEIPEETYEMDSLVQEVDSAAV